MKIKFSSVICLREQHIANKNKCHSNGPLQRNSRELRYQSNFRQAAGVMKDVN